MTSRNNTVAGVRIIAKLQEILMPGDTIDSRNSIPNNSQNYSLYNQKLAQFQNIVPSNPSLPNESSQEKWTNFDENKYKVQPGPTAQSKITKILNRKQKAHCESLEVPLAPPRPMPMSVVSQILSLECSTITRSSGRPHSDQRWEQQRAYQTWNWAEISERTDF